MHICAGFPHSGSCSVTVLDCLVVLCHPVQGAIVSIVLGMGQRGNGPRVCVHVRCDLNGNEQRWGEEWAINVV